MTPYRHQPTSVLRIQCWSGPRNVSTALMYSFRQRPDTTVVDEPLYAHYLSEFDRGHPAAELAMASQSTDVAEVVQNVILGPCPTRVLFIKQMAHHLQGLDSSFLAETENILLTRDPRDMLPSLAVQLPSCGLADTGLVEQVDLIEAIVARGGTPLVVDSQSLLADPPGVLRAVCNGLGLGFDEAMLRWPAGAKPEDGAWAPEWYHNVHKSTGFGQYVAKTEPLPDHLIPVLEQAAPLYDRLQEFVVAV